MPFASALSAFAWELRLRITRRNLDPDRSPFIPLANATLDPQYCAHCSLRLVARPRHKCGGCRSVYYCDRQCQVAHWPVHKLCCQPDGRLCFVPIRPLQASYLSSRDSTPNVYNPHVLYCAACGTALLKPCWKCSRCRQVYYCHKQCQTEHWPQHKGDCNLVLRDDEGL